MAILSTTGPSPRPNELSEPPRAGVAADDLLRAAHELKAPAAAMLGLAELLASDPGDPPSGRQATHLRHLMSAGRQLLALVDDLLDLSRAEAGRLPLGRQALDLVELAREAVALCNAAAGRPVAGLRVADGAAVALGDARRVRQVLANLLSNAVKFNRPGAVAEVCVGPGPSVTVADAGAGMDAGQLARLFRPFDRLGREADGAADGCGVGLALSQALARAMRGTLTVASTPGIGTTVTLALPAVPRPVAEPAAEPCLLCIDDNPVTALMLQEHFRRTGGPGIRMAGNGREGLALAHAARPRAVLLGLALPDLPGLQVLERLRNDAATRQVPVAIVTASVNGDEMRRARALGARACWPKPLDLGRVDALLSDLLHAPVAAAG